MGRCEVFAAYCDYLQKNRFSAVFRSPCEFLGAYTELD